MPVAEARRLVEVLRAANVPHEHHVYPEYDFCSTGDYIERGIKGAHGFMSEWFTERAQHLIPVPQELREVAVLLEPLSILERSYRLIDHIQQRLVWQPERVIITGAGNMGIMAAFLAGLRGLDMLIYSKGEQPDSVMRRWTSLAAATSILTGSHCRMRRRNSAGRI